MAESNQGSATSESLEDLFEPVLGDMADDDLQELGPVTSDKQLLAAKRRRAEQRLEERRLRDELGYYDLELDDF